MRCYHFGNFYMSSIQQGIQAAHCQMELVLKYDLQSGDALAMLWDWMHNHKTMICLNGGMLTNMEELWEFLDREDNPFPYAKFHESEEALGGILTNIAIVLPERIYEAASLIRSGKWIFQDGKLVNPTSLFHPVTQKAADMARKFNEQEYSMFEQELIQNLNQYSLAR